MSEKLSLLDNSSDSEVDFKINENYAHSYDVWRNKEELQKYKDLKKEEDSESSSESEDEIPVSSDEEFLTALSICKSKDPRIYDKNYKQFDDENKEKEKPKMKVSKEKPMYMKDYERNLVLEKGGKFSDEDEEEVVMKRSVYDEEQENLKKSFKEALGDSSDDDNDNDLLKVREKTTNEKEAEEAEYMKWLKGEKEGVSEDVKKNLSYLHDYWNDPKLDEKEKFLRDYFLNKKYLEEDDSELPTYEEITKGALSDEEMLEEQEKFEVKYNFRFEEPDEEYIKRYPRNFADSLRKVDNRRKQKRDERAEKKRVEKLQRREELKRLKALKRKEIEEKFLKLKEVCGQEEINLNESDIESDFDPDKHDQKMREMFSDDYYQVEEEQKPVFPYDEELDSENWNAWTGEKVVDDEGNKNETDGESDSHENEEISDQNKVITNPREEFEKEMLEATLPKKKARKKSLFSKIISQCRPLYDPNGKSFEEYLDEYYKLDYEDVIGDMPVRYKYRKVVPNDFGLTMDEILAADDRELNRWCSVKKTCQYRNEEEEIYDVQAYQKKGQNTLAKKKNFPSLFAPKDIDNNNAVMTKHKKKGYLEESCSSAPDNEIVANDDENQHAIDEDMSQNSNEVYSVAQGDENKKKSKKKKKKDNSLQSQFDTSAEILDTTSPELCDKYSEQNLNSENSSVEVGSRKKSKKKKHKEHDSSLFSADSEYLNTKSKRSGVESIVSENTPESLNPEQSDVHMAQKINDTQDSIIYDEPKKKSKKKSKDRQNTSKSIDVDTYDNKNNLQSSNLENNSCKSTKRKRDSDTDPMLTENQGIEESSSDNASKRFSCKSKSNNVSNINQPSSTDVQSNFVSEAPVQEPSRKKKKKKKKHRQNQNDVSNNTVSNYKQWKNSTASKDQRHFENISGDKRCGLTDERLAAYGINPKKFKNKIMYSKK